MIGVFDSGHGGLTVLHALTQRMPAASFTYFGDHGNAPYGPRPEGEIYTLTLAAVERLFAEGCSLVLIACNTASAVALRRLQQDWLPDAAPERRVLGVFVPMVEALSAVSWRDGAPGPKRVPEDGMVAVFATQRTIHSGAYPFEVGLRAPRMRVVSQACPNLVAAIEADEPEDVLHDLVTGYVAAMLKQTEGRVPEAAVLGCTHYPLVAHLFAAVLPSSVQLLDQPTIVADSLADYLTRHPRFAVESGQTGARRFLTSGDPARVAAFASRFFGSEVTFQAVGELNLL
ncbi:glutamate racemase [Pelagibius litoralis]|uniref:Glutamate racemase n=1 Tax=Pelagibius litoralis TaxID=374515 RepID=A0A967F1P9_9PROT|nr:aspartate/glutamate racemase family protein [Pelagibius litoralis]NIA71538.1 glutamate racemase [Pelagibius litoralis]